ncbi:ABC transporter permease [Methylobacterium pseudosasicola]|uniref:Peptide/nickel transport system permease protein n=1 Tax=Methylobacterium pseudosasicola TaxID=582667 RepID=A0A1I4JYS5_9HYPH|nr:ABC transporter permease [Methylobacterium pseudosasicola]SFL71491.1 peptide/nickel transport system permease protein [Methylobacterium pseudosasicola]
MSLPPDTAALAAPALPQNLEVPIEVPAALAPVRSPTSLALRRGLHHGGFLIGAGILGLIVLAALAAPLIAPHDPYAQDVSRRLIPPIWQAKGTWDHVLGTDKLGRDYLSRLLYGGQISLLIGISAALISGVIGTVLGLCAGYFGGWVDSVVSYIVTTRLAMPVVLVALAMASLVGGSLKVVVLVLGFLLWDRFAVVTRAATQQIRNQDFVSAARAAGLTDLRIIGQEILPNILNALIVVATLEMAHAILLEAALSFLGLGVQPPLPSWGLMIAEGKQYMFFQPWVITIPGVALLFLVLAINLLGDGLRDITAPEGRN